MVVWSYGVQRSERKDTLYESCSTLLYSTLLLFVHLYILYCTVLYCTVLCCTVLYSTVLYTTSFAHLFMVLVIVKIVIIFGSRVFFPAFNMSVCELYV